MKKSGFSLVESMVSLTLTLVLAMGIAHLFLAGARVLKRVEGFREKQAPFLLASQIADDMASAVLWDGPYFYRAVGVGYGGDGGCQIIYGKGSRFILYKGHLTKNCPHGEFVVYLRRKRIYLKENNLYVEINGKPQPMASGLRSFAWKMKDGILRVMVDGREVLRRLP